MILFDEKRYVLMAGIIAVLGILSGGCGTASQQESTSPQFHAGVSYYEKHR